MPILKPDSRSTTKFSFNIGYLFVGLVVLLVVVGMFNGLITAQNFPSVLDSLLYPAVGFFGVSTFRVASENIGGVRRDEAGNSIPPVPTPEVQINDVKVQNADAIVGDAANVDVNLPPTQGQADLPFTPRRF